MVTIMERIADAELERVELHTHSNMSDMDGVTPAGELIKHAFERGYRAVAVTDSGNVCAFPEIMNAAEKIRNDGGDIKPIYGMEAFFINDSASDEIDKLPVYRISVLVRNKTGLKNLYRLISLSYLEYFRRVPRIPLSVLRDCREGLLIGSGCVKGELFQALLEDRSQAEIDLLAEFYDYFEIQPTAQDDEEQKAINKSIVRLADRHGKPCAAVGNVRFTGRDDMNCHKVIRHAVGYCDTNDKEYFMTTGEMLDEFQYLGEDKAFKAVVTDTNAIADMIDGDIRPIPEGRFLSLFPDAERELSELCRGRARELYGDPLPGTVESRLERELELIGKNGYSDIYMAARKLITASEKNGYHVGSRGAVGSSLAAAMAGITGVDPLLPHYLCPKCRHSEFVTDGSVGSGYELPQKNCPKCGADMTRDGLDIPFETFLGINGEKEPDIDLNFSAEIQEKIHLYAEELFGRGRVFKAGVISTVREIMARGFAERYLRDQGLKPDRTQKERLAVGCIGVKRALSNHPGGLIIIPHGYEVCDFTPVQFPTDRSDEEIPTTQFDYFSLRDTLVKFDLLGHGVPTIYKLLEDMTGIKISDVPMTDPLVYKLFTSAEPLALKEDIGGICGAAGTLGIPEFGSNFVMKLLSETQPKTFSELMKISGLSHGTDVWYGNAEELIRGGVCAISDVIAARDDILLYLTRKGIGSELAYRISEITRMGKARKLFDDEIYEAFKEHNIPEWYVESLKKVGYLFPKAHAAAYVTAAVKLAWFKIYRPAEFYAAILTKRTDEMELNTIMKGKEAIRQRIEALRAAETSPRENNIRDMLRIILELMSRGIEVLSPDIVRSTAETCTVEDGKIRLPLAAVRGVGGIAAQKIKEAAENFGCQSPDEIQQKSGVSVAVIERLKEAGAFN